MTVTGTIRELGVRALVLSGVDQASSLALALLAYPLAQARVPSTPNHQVAAKFTYNVDSRSGWALLEIPGSPPSKFKGTGVPVGFARGGTGGGRWVRGGGDGRDSLVNIGKVFFRCPRVESLRGAKARMNLTRNFTGL